MSEVKTEKVHLTVSQIQADLANGLDRAAIAEKYNLTKGGVKQLFSHPKLKGMKVKPAPNFVLEDDTADKPAKTSNGASTSTEEAVSVETQAASAKAKGVW